MKEREIKQLIERLKERDKTNDRKERERKTNAKIKKVNFCQCIIFLFSSVT